VLADVGIHPINPSDHALKAKSGLDPIVFFLDHRLRMGEPFLLYTSPTQGRRATSPQ
jgi:hypothetical protein